MPILENIVLTDLPQQFKAPTGLMYMVESIHLINLTAEVGTLIFVGDYNLHVLSATDSKEPTNWLAIHHCDTVSDIMIRGINEKTKFLIAHKNSSTLINGRITVYGTLVKASRTQLLIEWFRKVR